MACKNWFKALIIIILVFAIFIVAGCNDKKEIEIDEANDNLTLGDSYYRDFLVDNVYHSDEGDIHFHMYIPSNYDVNNKYALFISLPGYNGLYFQGVGANIKTEDFVFEALNYNSEMIIVAPQLNDWQNTSANQTIALTLFMLENYSIDRNKVYIDGYSGGGETLSLVLSKRPELYTRALHIASIWDGSLDLLVKARTKIYFIIGENDEYYGSKRIKNTYNELVKLYQNENLDDKLYATLNILDDSYFNGGNQHGGIGRISHDDNIMGWLFL